MAVKRIFLIYQAHHSVIRAVQFFQQNTSNIIQSLFGFILHRLQQNVRSGLVDDLHFRVRSQNVLNGGRGRRQCRQRGPTGVLGTTWDEILNQRHYQLNTSRTSLKMCQLTRRIVTRRNATLLNMCNYNNTKKVNSFLITKHN